MAASSRLSSDALWAARTVVLALVAILLPKMALAQTTAPEEPGAEEPGAEEPASNAPEAAWFLQAALQARVNPLGLTLYSQGGYRVPLSSSDDLLLSGTELKMGLTTAIAPVFIWAGPYVEVTPLAFLKLHASAQRLFYFGADRRHEAA